MMRKTLLLGSATLVVVALAVFSLTLPSETQTLMTTSPDVLTTPESGSGGNQSAYEIVADCPVYEEKVSLVKDPATGEWRKVVTREVIRIDFGRKGTGCDTGSSSCTPDDPCS